MGEYQIIIGSSMAVVALILAFALGVLTGIKISIHRLPDDAGEAAQQ
jgi:hypothetical protein